MSHSNEEIIIKELQKGNKGVFRQIFNQYYPLLYKFAHKYVCEDSICEDVVQDAFVSLWEKRKTAKPQSLKSYLYAIVRNKCCDYLRHLNVKDKNEIFLLESYLEIHLETHPEKERTTELAGKINKILNSLPENMRYIFEQKYLNGLTASEIAEDLSITENTVNTHLKRAKKKIKSKLSESNLNFLFFCFAEILN